MKPNASTARFRGRALKRGVASVLPRFFNGALLTGGTAILMAGSKLFDYSVTQRGLTAQVVQEAIQQAASSCAGKPVSAEYDGVRASAFVGPSVNTDLMAPISAMLPPEMLTVVPRQVAFPYAHMPIRGMTAEGFSSRTQAEDQPNGTTTPAVHTSTASLQISCQDVLQQVPTAVRVKALSQPINARAFAAGLW